MLRFKRSWMLLVCLISMLMACSASMDSMLVGYADGMGGAQPALTLPFRSGEYWILTQGYGSYDEDYRGSHRDYGFTYGDDTYALDFSQSGCDAYGDSVTPMADGMVLEANEEGSSGDHGYGNNVLMDHGAGFVSRYAHLSEILVSEEDELDDDDALGKVGNTGYAVGSSCSSYPGTHLHVAFYWEEESERPEPLSGVSPLTVGCWYNREGDESCSSDPGDYEHEEGMAGEEEDDPYDDDGDVSSEDACAEDELCVTFLDISPEQGTANDTEYIWVATVVSPNGKPEVMLNIRNPNDGETYSFTMETENEESPYVFSHRKTLQDDDSTYSYWVTAEEDGMEDQSNTQSVHVDEEEGSEPELMTFTLSPISGEAGETVFTWSVEVESGDEPELSLQIVNPHDATLYSFSMNPEWNGESWYAEYEKTLNDSTIYTYWVLAENRHTSNTGIVLSVETE